MKKHIGFLVLLGVPLLAALFAFLGSLYFVDSEDGSGLKKSGENQPAITSISTQNSPLVLQQVSPPGQKTESVKPADPTEKEPEPAQESPETEEPQSLKEPPFYKPSNEDLAKLNPEQLVIYNGIMEDYLKFYAEWSKNTPDDVDAWNRKIQECNQQIRFMLGPEASNLINFR